MSTLRLTRNDAAELARYFRETHVISGGIKAQNYEAFKTFSKDRGGVVDRDGEIVRGLDDRHYSEADAIVSKRVAAIRAKMFETAPRIAARAWCTLDRAFSKPAREASKTALPPPQSPDLYGPPGRRNRDESRERHLGIVSTSRATTDELLTGYSLFDQFQAVFRNRQIARLVPWTDAALERGHRDWDRVIARRAAKGDYTECRLMVVRWAYDQAMGAGLSPFDVNVAVLEADAEFKDAPSGAELHASVMRALDVASSKDAHDHEFLAAVQDEATARMSEASAAWAAAREAVDLAKATKSARALLDEDLAAAAE